MDVGANLIILVKNSTIISFKDNIKNITKYLTKFYNMVLKRNSMVLGYRPLLSIGYNCRFWEVLSFITTDMNWSVKYDNACLSKWTGRCYNVYVFPISIRHIMVKLFLSFNEITPTTNTSSQWKFSRLLNVIGCGYVL